MALFDKNGPADALEDLFGRERRAILGGRFDVLERLAHEKERRFEAVIRRERDAERLDRLKAIADRNRTLLQAMERGVRAAGERLQRASERARDLKTYDASGRRTPISTVPHALQHRA